jgi:hypothetical protein
MCRARINTDYLLKSVCLFLVTCCFFFVLLPKRRVSKPEIALDSTLSEALISQSQSIETIFSFKLCQPPRLSHYAFSGYKTLTDLLCTSHVFFNAKTIKWHVFFVCTKTMAKCASCRRYHALKRGVKPNTHPDRPNWTVPYLVIPALWFTYIYKSICHQLGQTDTSINGQSLPGLLMQQLMNLQVCGPI